ncbi:unnamed protein product [Schistocephalus solidus]|uniref:Uncharacterized protein n=1 Tax=Schistocephalus solidus TaxID=70667 RepID=A0A183TN76_SCHSO|nr:unnamed protein product [Schistocephalus solidus]
MLNSQQIHQLGYISQLTLGLHRIDGSRNELADALFRPSIENLQCLSKIDLTEMAVEQRHIGSLCDKDVNGRQLQDLPLTTGDGTTLCDISTTCYCPFLP